MASSSEESKINISFELQFDEALARNRDRMHRLEVLRDVGGPMTICIGSKVFFNEPYVPLLELGVFLWDWAAKVYAGETEDFVYESIEHYEPILEFHMAADGTWRISSVWQLFDPGATFSTGELIGLASDFLARLRHAISALYGIEFNDYIKG